MESKTPVVGFTSATEPLTSAILAIFPNCGKNCISADN
jgi:hypothetical protein